MTQFRLQPSLAGWSGVSYDADGSLLNDSFNSYTWNVYGELASANGAAVVYDAFDRMVENHGGTYEFAYAPTGTHPLAWLQGQTLSGAQLPLPGNAFAIYNGSGLAQYNHADWLGSARLFSTPVRAASAAMSYAPFGEGYAGGIQDIQFTSFSSSYTVSNTESQGGTLDDFTFRRYSPVQGRWISPDPAGLGAVNPANPQTWNRYAYVANNPLSYVDPLGLFRAFPGQCEGGEGICPDEGAGADPSSIDGGSYVGGMVFQLTIPGYWVNNGQPDDPSWDWVGPTTTIINLGPQYPPSMFTPVNNMPTVSQYRPPKPDHYVTGLPAPYKPSAVDCFTGPNDAVEKMSENTAPIEHDPNPAAAGVVYQNSSRGTNPVVSPETVEGMNSLTVFLSGFFNWFGCMVNTF